MCTSSLENKTCEHFGTSTRCKAGYHIKVTKGTTGTSDQLNSDKKNDDGQNSDSRKEDIPTNY